MKTRESLEKKIRALDVFKPEFGLSMDQYESSYCIHCNVSDEYTYEDVVHRPDCPVTQLREELS